MMRRLSGGTGLAAKALLVLTLVLASCGGSDGGEAEPPPQDAQEEEVTTAQDDSTETDSGADGSSAVAGEVRAEVDGQSFVLENVNVCNISEDEFAFGASTPAVDVDASGGGSRGPRGWVAQIGIREVGGESAPVYSSLIPSDGSGLVIEGRSLTYSGDFSKATVEVPLGEDVGRGQVSVACE